MEKPTKTKSQLRQEIKEAKAQQAYVYYFAENDIQKLCEDRLAGSGVLVELTLLGGKSACSPFVLRDGLSKETIEAIRKDILKSYNLATSFKPSGA